MTITTRPDSRQRGRLRGLVAVFTVGALALATATVAGAAPVGVPVADPGTITLWGSSSWPAPSGDDFTAIATSDYQSMALTSDGHIKSWGRDDDAYQLRDTPQGPGFKAIAIGDRISMALTSDGHIKSWGMDYNFLLSGTPTDGGFTAISVVGGTAMALTADGNVTTWGNGAAEWGTTTGGGFTAIAAGIGFSMALRSDGTITSWGWEGDALVAGTPTGGSFTAIAAGEGHAMALTADGHITTWARDDYKGLVTHTPTDGGFTAIAASNSLSIALGSDGTITSWSWDDTPFPGTPTGGGFTAIAASNSHAVALKKLTAPAFTDPGRVNAVAGTAFTHTFAVTGNPVPVVSLLAPSTPPPGMTFTNGTLGGTPTTAGTYTFTIRASSTNNPDATLDVTVTVDPAPPAAPAFVDTGQVVLRPFAGTEFTRAFAATGNPTPVVSVADESKLPPGMSFIGGTLGGTPTLAGTYRLTVTADNGVGTPATLDVVVAVAKALAAPEFTDVGPVTVNAATGINTNRTFAVTGSPTPVVSLRAPSTPPPGMTFSNGVLRGTPTTTGTYTFTIKAVSAPNPDATLDVTVIVTESVAPTFDDAGPVTVNAVAGTAFTRAFTAAGNPSPLVVPVVPATLPPGMTFGNGALTGTPTTTGTYTFKITAINNKKPNATLDVTVIVAAAQTAPTFDDVGPLTLNGIADTAFTHTFAATGNPAPTYTSGTLPTGLSLDPTTGVLSGTPTTTGPFTFTITATNNAGNTTLDVTLTIAAAPAAPTFTDAGPVTLNAVTKTALTREFTVTGNPTPAISVLDESKLPTGMRFINGALTGTPTTVGTYKFTLVASNGVGTDLTLDVTVNVTDDPTTPEQPTTGSLGSLNFFGFGS